MAEIITSADFAGRHNADLQATSERLTREGAWKRQRTILVIPGGTMIPAKVYVSHRSIIVPPNNAFVPLYIEQAEVGKAYETALDVILANKDLREFEWLLTLENDNTPGPTALLDLIKAHEEHPGYAVISGLYFTKGVSGAAQCWGSPAQDPVVNFRPQPPRPGEVMEVYGVGMGCALWRMSHFRELEAKKVLRPWFKTINGRDDQGNFGVGTQDLYHWGAEGPARKIGARCAVDCRVLVGHYDAVNNIIW